jgi:ABC-2 type transport system permease protein
MVVRDTAGLVIPLGLPLLILAMQGLSAQATAPIPELEGLRAFDVFVVPLTLVMVTAVIGIVNMPSFLATYRTTGVLRRLAVTPAHPMMVLVAQVVVSVVQSAVGIALALAVATLAFDLSAPRDLLLTAGVLLLTAATMYAVGMLLAALAPTANAAVAIGLVVFLAIMAVGGGFGSPDNLPAWLARIGELLPFGAALQSLRAAWTGAMPDALHLGSLTVTTLIASLLAVRLFRWE